MATTDTSATKPKTRIVTLTDHPPVKIKEDDWPVIAESRWFEGQYDFQANRSAWLKVRQHDDGRTLVYAGSRSAFMHEPDYAGGELLATSANKAIIAAIHRVAETVGYHDQLAACAIADLPVEEI